MAYYVRDIYDCDAYACYLKDDEELMKSTSGGAFFGIAKYVIEKGGIVFGAVAISPYEVMHKSVSDLKGLDEIRKSKYVQSRIGDTYKEAQKYLMEGRIVLFSGTPCQIAGLKSFLGKDYERLFTVDVICHGVPSSEMLKRHIKHLESKYGSIIGYGFRDKVNGWSTVTEKYELENESVYAKAYDDAYFFVFDQYLTLRPVCYECPFRRLNSEADITIGDYWAIQHRHPEVWNDNGVSAVIIKSEKGKKLFESCLDEFIYIESDVRKIAAYNVFVIRSRGKNKARELFFDLWKNGESDYFKIYNDIKKKVSVKKIGIIGSYNSRLITRRWAVYDEGVKIAWHITNSSLCSMMGRRVIEYNPLLPVDMNEYRKNSVTCDVYKKAPAMISEGEHCDYIILDLLEERYSVFTKNSNIICTKSEAFEEANIQTDFEEREMLDIEETDWQITCLKFIQLLMSSYQPNQIVLLRLLLTENNGNTRAEEKFRNVEKIQKINSRLCRYYDYLEDNMPGINIVNTDNMPADYCYKYFPYGCKPEYYNIFRYNQIRDAIVNVMETSYE